MTRPLFRQTIPLLLLLTLASALAQEPAPDPPADDTATRVAAALRQLNEDNPDERRAGAEALGALGPAGAGAIPDLLGLLRDRDPGVRAAVARALGNIERQPPVVVPALVALLQREEVDWVRQDVVDAIGAFGATAAQAVPALQAALDDESAYVREGAALGLGAIGQPATPAIERLLAIVADDPWMHARLAALEALRDIGVQAWRRVPVLAKALADPYEHVRLSAAEQLTGLGPAAAPAVAELQAALDDEYEYARGAAAKALGAIGGPAAPAVPDLAEMLRTDVAPRNRRLAADALAAILPAGEDALIAALADTSLPGEIRSHILGLVKLADPDRLRPALGALVALLGDPSIVTRGEARTAIEGMGKPALSAVRDALTDANPWVREGAIRLLASIGDPADIRAETETLVRSLGDSSRGVMLAAQSAIRALGRLETSAIPVVFETWQEARPLARGSLAAILADMPPEALVAHIIELGRLLRESEGLAGAILLRTIGRLGEQAEPAIPSIIAVLTGNDDRMREAALGTLLDLGPAANAAVPALGALVRTSDDEEVRWRSVVVLGRIGTDGTLPPVEHALQDASPSVRVAACRAAAAIRDAAVVPALIEVLDDEEPGVRLNAIQALAFFGADARLAVPRLREIANDVQALPDLRQAANRSLAHIIGRPGGD